MNEVQKKYHLKRTYFPFSFLSCKNIFTALNNENMKIDCPMHIIIGLERNICSTVGFLKEQ